MPQIQVLCTVSNCNYWAQGNLCVAEKILVASDSVGAYYPNSVDAGQTNMIVAQMGETPVSGCTSTCCKTFEHRKSS